MPIELGRLSPIALRDIWEDEAIDFTPWLAEAENLALLGETLGMELEAQEIHVGDFRADILCRDTFDNARVLIENQLERADHEHLGKILRRVYNGVYYEKVGFLSLSIATIAIGMCQRCKDVR